MHSVSFWRVHAAWPLLAFALVFGLIDMFGLDRALANAWWFDPLTHRWLGGGPGDWWAHRLLHNGGRWLVRAVAGAALVVWVGSYFLAAWRGARSRAGFIALSMIVAISVVGALKAITDIDCPWDLVPYGGNHPDIALFAPRPAYLPQARCFPGAHSASGFALLCLYFAWRGESPVRARWGLAAGILCGTLFAVGQEARGAHFLSHDLASAAVVWFVQLALYVWLRAPAAARRGAAAPDTALPRGLRPGA